MRTLCVILSVFTLLLLTAACKGEDADWIAKEPGRSILDLEYINDTLGIRLRDIRSVQIAPDSFRINVYVIPDRESRFDASHRFFLHLYEDQSREGDQSFLPAGTREFGKKEGVLIYSRRFRSNNRKFTKLRYGMIGPDGTRLFTLTVDTLKLEL